MKVTAALPAGVSALFFEAADRLRRLEADLAATLEGAGFSEVVLPILDYLEPYDPLLTPAGRSELYRFIDRDGEQLALRADFTTLLARLLAPRLQSLELPLRFFYRGDVVRYQEDRPGRGRESYQMGAELLGVPGTQAEHEMFRLCLELALRSGLEGLRVVMGFAGALDRPLLDAAARGAVPEELAAAVERRERATARAAGPALLEVVEHGAPSDPEALGEDAATALRGLEALSTGMQRLFPKIGFTIDLAEFARFTRAPELGAARGRRSYYDGLLFRVYAAAGADPIAGGGRYDQLFRSLGAEVPAVGFYLAIDRILARGGGSEAAP
ncbi:MAG: ATP phosphoribosyltransferase regulatory subunit [Acidobacteria bacterium]|nr:ATP phosphoribosyltransferase regulatory subunit [Acidobacteriota bacterium]